ncbi:adenylate kinase [Christensenella intestinihominis]|uniref:adenylate kinase n=1 Tax=Christensenella intestinihominis TaxID=1851429 RepID=UPI00082CF76B|nr:adenylate kinase [Christensenella intestinihominis]
MNVIFLGPPGSGKGTMAVRVGKEMNLAHISTGDMLRAEMKAGSELGKLAKSYIDKGALVPDQVIIDMMGQRMKADDAKGGVLLDGFPRTVAQAEALDGIAKIDAVVNLEVDVQVIVDRVLARRVCPDCGAVYSTKNHNGETCDQCGSALITRADDNEETVRERFRVYEEQTAPLIEFYSKRGLVANVDGTMPIEEEAAYIVEVLKKV